MGKTPTVPLCGTASPSCTNFGHMAAFKMRWEGARLNTAGCGTAWQPSPGCCTDLYSRPSSSAGLKPSGQHREGEAASKNLQVSSPGAQSQTTSEIQMKDRIHPTSKCYTCGIPWLHAAGCTSSAFRKTSDTGGNAWAGFAFVRNHRVQRWDQ